MQSAGRPAESAVRILHRVNGFTDVPHRFGRYLSKIAVLDARDEE